MTPVILLQADEMGLSDLSSYSRPIFDRKGQTSIIDGQPYYNMAGNTYAKWRTDQRLPFSDKKITIEGWIYLDSLEGAGHLFGGRNGSYLRGFFLGFGSSGSFLFSTAGGKRHLSSYTSVPVQEATHFAWVLDGSSKRLYINGNIFASDVNTEGLSTPDALTFGYSSDSNNPEGGLANMHIHQLIVWDGVRYDANFLANYVDYGQQILPTNDIPNEYKYLTSDFNGFIADKVLIKGVPAARKVCAYDRRSNELVAVTWSDSFGNYHFDNLLPDTEYYVVALDHERNYNAVIQDMIKAEL